MFRQVAVSKEKQDVQRIVWRVSQSDTLRSFTLATITYGFTLASFMATQCFASLAEAEELKHPKASIAVHWDFYMDDLIADAETVKECILLQKQTRTILDSAKFPLRK